MPGDLAAALERQYAAYNREDAARDPVHLLRRYRDPADLEIAAFCTAALAFGRVEAVIRSAGRLLARLGPRPAAFVRRFHPARDRAVLRGFVHRWVTARDVAALLWVLRQMLERAGSIERFFLEGFDERAEDTGPALDSFGARALALDLAAAYGRVPRRPGVAGFFPRPGAGSACKRLNLFLRWMVRRDGVDLGVWRGVPASKLVVPLDTHVIRLGRCLGLTRYRSPGWRMAADLTRALRRIDPHDPVRFDFALCHIGIAGLCRGDGRAGCPLRPFCRGAAG
ncbi:MAG TPA: TIGR02757 family protein [Vicinamibacterales bacterium]|nr:TIGR02757 family protein [Vicinamibacterales bacterium]